MILSGGPGTGKTTTINTIIRFFEAEGMDILLAAPTGRAAKRMTETTGFESKTIHRLLEINGSAQEGKSAQFERNEENPLEADVLIIDEMSMVDIHLMQSLLKAVTVGTRLILVGDVNQLPSVGAGDVFRQLIDCGLIPVTVLDMVYRQGASSNIPVNANLIQQNRTSLFMGEDFIFVPCDGTEPTAEMVKKLYLEEVQKYGLEQVQILTSYRVKTAAGVVELNRTLEDLI